MSFHMGRHISLVPAITFGLLILFTRCPLFAAPPAAAQRILVINSYHSGLSWTDSVMNGIRDVFVRSGRNSEISVEYLDARRFTDTESSQRIRELLTYKLKRTAPDVVLVSDNAALDFVIEHRATLFPEVPVVFCGINHYSPSMISGSKRMTGVAEDVSVGDTVGLALRLHPGTRELIVIGRTSVAADKANRDSLVDALPFLPSRIKVFFWDDLPLPALRSRLEKLTAGSVVLLNGLLQDETGRQLMYGETTEWVRQYTSVPIYSLWDVYLGYGIVGGKLVSGYRQGRIAAELALRILNGESADRIPVITARDANKYTFDYREIERLGISPSTLPRGSIFINRPDTLYHLYKKFIWILAGVVLVLAGFLSLLSATIFRRRRAEEQLRQANLVVENSPAVLFRWKAAEGWPVELVSANVSQFGYTPEELLSGKVSFSSMVFPEDLDTVSTEVKEYSSVGVDRFQQEYRLLAKDGSVRWIDDRTVIERDVEGRVTHYQGIVIDITNRKKAEEELRLAQYCIDNASISIALFDRDRIIKVNDHMCKTLGYTSSELTGMTVFDIDPLMTKDKFSKLARQIDENGYNPPFEGRHRRKDGSVFPVELTSNHLRLEGRDLVISFGQDITVRKRAEEALRLSERKYRDIVENSPIGIFRSNLEGKFLSANPALARILKYDSPEELIREINRKSAAEVIYTGAERRKKVVERSLLSYEWTVYEEQFRCKDGSIVTLNVHHRSVPGGDVDSIEFEGFGEDITKRKRAENALRESEEKFRVLAETSPTAIILCQGESIIYSNPAATRISGYMAEELSRMKFWDCIHEDFRETVRERGLARQRGEAVPEQYESVIVTRWGEQRRVVVSGASIDYGEKPTSIITLLDISEARRAEEKLRQSQEMFSSAFRASPDSVNINRLCDGLYLDVNEGFCVMTGYTAEEVLGKTSVELNIWVRLEDRERLVREMTGHGFVTNLEAEFRRKDGSVLIGQMSAQIVEIDGALCIVNIVRDVTERKRAEEQIRASLAEKIVLLKEIHHRVKNNMQIISSLLELQSDSIADEASRKFISESQNRIRSMALVHEKLYHAESFASISFGDYIDSLTQYLFSTFVKDPDLILFTIDAGDFSLGIDEAIPCGLIVNELVSNSLKHAFPDGRKGEISVRCRTEEDGRVALTVSDNGVGLPPDLDFRNTETLGLQLVTMLVKQLRGDIELDGAGTTFVIRFRSEWSREGSRNERR